LNFEENMIKKKIKMLSGIFYEKISIPLFINIPMDEIEDVADENVSDEDSLLARLNNVSNIVDRINKKELDKFTSVKTRGSKLCLITTLKHMFRELHDEINIIEENLDILFLMRAFFTHKRNRNIQIAFDKLNIIEGETEENEIWYKCKILFEEVLDNITNLFHQESHEIIQDEIDKEVYDNLIEIYLAKHNANLSNGYYKKYITYLLHGSEVIDTEMAKNFNVGINKLREDLLCFYPNLLQISFYTEKSCKIEIKEIFKDPIKLYYEKEAE